MPPFTLAAIISSITALIWLTTRTQVIDWIATVLHRPRNERGEAPISLVIIAVTLILAMTILIVSDKAVPQIFQTGLSSVFAAIGTTEAWTRKQSRPRKTSTRPPSTPPKE
jgi:Na+/pantothenate symporter